MPRNNPVNADLQYALDIKTINDKIKTISNTDMNFGNTLENVLSEINNELDPLASICRKFNNLIAYFTDAVNPEYKKFYDGWGKVDTHSRELCYYFDKFEKNNKNAGANTALLLFTQEDINNLTRILDQAHKLSDTIGKVFDAFPDVFLPKVAEFEALKNEFDLLKVAFKDSSNSKVYDSVERNFKAISSMIQEKKAIYNVIGDGLDIGHSVFSDATELLCQIVAEKKKAPSPQPPSTPYPGTMFATAKQRDNESIKISDKARHKRGCSIM